jgi:hypothetical protein
MPFPVRLTFTEDVVIRYINMETGMGGRNWGTHDMVKIGPFGVYELSYSGPTPEDPCLYNFTLHVENLVTSKIVHVVTEGVSLAVAP